MKFGRIMVKSVIQDIIVKDIYAEMGVIELDAKLLNQANIKDNEYVKVFNVTTGDSFDLFAMSSKTKECSISCMKGINQGDILNVYSFMNIDDNDTNDWYSLLYPIKVKEGG